MRCARLDFSYKFVSMDDLLSGSFMAACFDEPFSTETGFDGVERVCGRPVDVPGSHKQFPARLRDLRKQDPSVPEFVKVPEKKTPLARTFAQSLLKSDSVKTIIFKGLKGSPNMVWCAEDTLCVVGICDRGKFLVRDGHKLRPLKDCPRETRGKCVLTSSGVEPLDRKTHVGAEEFPFRVSRNILTAMERGPHREDLLGESILIFKREQRRLEKKCLWDAYVKTRGSLLDLGAGRGADLSFWRDRQLNVLAVEPNPDSFAILLRKSRGQYRFSALRAGGEDCEKIEEASGGPRDYVSMINSISFFFESERTLSNLMCTLDACTKPGSLFFGSLMDSQKVLKLIKPGQTYKKSAFEITVFREKGLTHKVRIHIDDTYSLVHDQTEYLSDFSLLTEKLQEIGFQLVKTGFYSTSLVAPDQEWFTALTRWFVFKKEK